MVSGSQLWLWIYFTDPSTLLDPWQLLPYPCLISALWDGVISKKRAAEVLLLTRLHRDEGGVESARPVPCGTFPRSHAGPRDAPAASWSHTRCNNCLKSPAVGEPVLGSFPAASQCYWRVFYVSVSRFFFQFYAALKKNKENNRPCLWTSGLFSATPVSAEAHTNSFGCQRLSWCESEFLWLHWTHALLHQVQLSSCYLTHFLDVGLTIPWEETLLAKCHFLCATGRNNLCSGIQNYSGYLLLQRDGLSHTLKALGRQ